MSSAHPFDQPLQDNMESGPGPPVDPAPNLQTQQGPRQTPPASAPQLPPFPLFPSWPPLNSVLQLPQLPQLRPALHPPQVPQVPQAVEAAEVIDLTGLSDGDDGDDWEDVPEVIDLTNIPSSDEDDHDDADADAELDDVPQNYTILNLPPRGHPLLNAPPVPGRTRTARRAEARAAARVARAAGRVPARVPVRRDICELCARVVRWGPGCLITKHHLYPQEITKKYPERYTQAQKGSLALICRPCHDVCHRAHSNRTLADFYNEVDLLKADPYIQAHISSMQRATTPELIARYGDGVNVRRRKEQVRAARAHPQRKLVLKQGKALNRSKLTETALAVPSPPPRPLRPRPPPPAPPVAAATDVGVRRSARLLARSMGGEPQVPVIVIEDEDEDMQDAAIHQDPRGEKNGEVQDIVNEAELAVLEALGQYIRL